MHGVTAEIAQEIVVLFQDDDLDPGAGQQQRMNQARGTATGNTDLGLQDLSHEPTLTCDQPGADTSRWARNASISRSKSSADEKDRYTEANRR